MQKAHGRPLTAVERLDKLSTMKLTRCTPPMKFGAARTKAPAARRLIELAVPKRGARFTCQLDHVFDQRLTW